MSCSNFNRCLNLYLVVIILSLLMQFHGDNGQSSVQISKSNVSKADIWNRVMLLLSKWNHSNDFNVNMQFSLLLSGFLIKQKIRFYGSTRSEKQMFYHILRNMNKILQKIHDNPVNNQTLEQDTILKGIFQKNILLLPPKFKRHHIQTHLEYKSLVPIYHQIKDYGILNATESDNCLALIVKLNPERCRLTNGMRKCLQILFRRNFFTYGYQRTHQILMLYTFSHHICSRKLAKSIEYDIVACEECSLVYREQKVIQQLHFPDVYRDLYLEQLLVCGLFGYVEFLNWYNIVDVMHWPQKDDCLCSFDYNNDENLLNCNCINHINTLLLVYYINGLLMLNVM